MDLAAGLNRCGSDTGPSVPRSRNGRNAGDPWPLDL
jgi:hypothetical protein